MLSEWAVLGMVQLTRLEGPGARVKPHTDPRFYGEFLVTVVLSSSRSSLELHAPGPSSGTSPLLRMELGPGDAYVLTKASLSQAKHQIELLGDPSGDAGSLSPPEPRFSTTLRYYSHDMSATTAGARGHSFGAEHEQFISNEPERR